MRFKIDYDIADDLYDVYIQRGWFERLIGSWSFLACAPTYQRAVQKKDAYIEACQWLPRYFKAKR